MTTLRGPDPYAAAETRLAPLLGGGDMSQVAVCRALQETIPTYTWVGIARRESAMFEIVAQFGRPMHTSPFSVAALPAASDPPLIVHDVANAPIYRRNFPGARALLVVPIAGESVLVVCSEHQGAFGLADRALLGDVARHLAERATAME